MSAGSAFLMLALLSFSGLGICHKVADFRRCRPSAVSVMLFLGGATVLWAYTLLYAVGKTKLSLFPPFTAAAVGVAVLCGAFSGIAILTFQIGIRYGRISTSWLVINLSTIVPAILSLVVYGEWKSGIKWQQLAGLALVLCSVFLLWRDKAVELARNEQPAGGFPVEEVKRAAPSRNDSVKPGTTAAAGEEA
jgi:drug/metabolite transporter (DMT)-like permease